MTTTTTDPGRSYTPEERAAWIESNTLPPPVLRLDVLRYQRRAREIAEQRARRVTRPAPPE